MLAADNRVVMVSGANRGIGRAVAVGLLARGYRLSLGARRPEALAGIAVEGQKSGSWASPTRPSIRGRPTPGSTPRRRASGGSTRW